MSEHSVAFEPKEFQKAVVDVQKTTVTELANCHRERTGLEGYGKTLVGVLKFLSALLHHAIQVSHARVGLLGNKPFLGQSMGQLEYFYIIEGLFENQQTIGGAQVLYALCPGIIRIGRA